MFESPSSLVTTVVISRNRRQEVVDTLARHLPPVILVDNGSNDGTAEAVRRAHPHVTVMALPGNVGAMARNIGVRLATTPYVAWADDDSWWEPAGVRSAVEVLQAHPTVGLVAARILVGEEDRLDPISTEMATSPLRNPPGIPGSSILGFVACASVIRRDAFLAVGGFDDVIFFYGEEQRVAYDLASSGWHLTYIDDIVVHHHPSPLRSSKTVRTGLVARSTLLTAVMRRPWHVVARLVPAMTTVPPGRSGVAAAIPRLPAAIARRKVLPPDIEQQARLLHHAAAKSVPRTT